MKLTQYILVLISLAAILLMPILLVSPTDLTPAVQWQIQQARLKTMPSGVALSHPSAQNNSTHPIGNGQDFVQFEEYSDGSAALKASVSTYANARGQRVTLIAAVHVADPAYYSQLKQEMSSYDVVLYEMIMHRGGRPPAPGTYRASNSISWLQLFMRDTLKMQFQVDGIDYRASNFVHDDMFYEDFQRLQDERGESMLKLMFRSAMHEAMRKRDPNEPAPVTLGDLLVARNSPDPARQYRLILGRQFASVDRQLAGMEGPNGSVIITERNRVALSGLDQQLSDGQADIAIFFGAGHMPGLEQGLLDRQFHFVTRHWVTAWSISPPADVPAR